MKIVIAAVGRLKDGPERALFSRYAERLQAMARTVSFGPLSVIELSESRASSVQARKSAEAQELLAGVLSAKGQGGSAKGQSYGRVVALDEHGEALTSAAFASLLQSWRDSGAPSVTFLIGGPDGHGREALGRADRVLSLGPMTLPHGLARVVLAEQIYRAATLAANHPYHRL